VNRMRGGDDVEAVVASEFSQDAKAAQRFTSARTAAQRQTAYKA
jgi:hypothetical protein